MSQFFKIFLDIIHDSFRTPKINLIDENLNIIFTLILIGLVIIGKRGVKDLWKINRRLKHQFLYPILLPVFISFVATVFHHSKSDIICIFLLTIFLCTFLRSIYLTIRFKKFLSFLIPLYVISFYYSFWFMTS